MKTLRRQTSWIHTIFVTDGERISHEQERLIRWEMDRVLRENRIVFGIHFASHPKERAAAAAQLRASLSRLLNLGLHRSVHRRGREGS